MLVKFSMAMYPQEENQLPLFAGSIIIINYLKKSIMLKKYLTFVPSGCVYILKINNYDIICLIIIIICNTKIL